jgi:hypothetical protein
MGWCSALFAILRDSHATDTAILDAVHAFIRMRAAERRL